MEFIITDSAKEQLKKEFKDQSIRINPKNKT
jgi:hypothetical protein